MSGFLDQGGKLGASTFTNLGGAASDLFTGVGDRAKAAGDFFEAKNYDLASALALKNEEFTKTSTAIKETQLQREAAMMHGGQEADIAGAGFTEGGSGLDIMADSARQAALTHAVASQQGLITEEGYQEQAASFKNMSEAATSAGNAANAAADFSNVTALIKGAAAIATLA